MKTPSFLEAVIVAAVGCAVAGVTYHSLLLFASGYEALRLVVAMTGLGYMSWLAARAAARSGRVFVMVLWGIGTFCTLLLDPPLLMHLVTQLAFFWLLRMVCHRRGVLSAFADAAISVLSVAFAIWAARETGSVFVTAWCVLLVQGLVALLPAKPVTRKPGADAGDADQRFERAQRAAHAALRRLSSLS